MWVLGESLASRRVDVMTDDDDGVTSASGLNGSLSLCLASLSLCLAPHYLSVFFFFFPSSVPLSLSLLCLLLSFFFFLLYMGHGLSEFFFFFFNLHGSWAL